MYDPNAQKKYHQRLRQRVIDHYGGKCAYCPSTDNLQLQHPNHDGAQHRRELFGTHRQGGWPFYLKLIQCDFQTKYELRLACEPCHTDYDRSLRRA